MLSQATRVAGKNVFRPSLSAKQPLSRTSKRFVNDATAKKKSPVPFSPVYAALPTPLNADGSLATADIAHNIQKWNDTLADGFLVLGSTGEAAQLTFKERAEVLHAVKKEASPRKQLFAGTGSASLKETKDMTTIAQELGYDAAMVVTPYYYVSRMDDAALEAYYTEVANSSAIPIIVYNNPHYTGVNMSVPLIKRLSMHPNIVGIKDASGLSEQQNMLVEETGEFEFEVLGSHGSSFMANILAGCPGSINSLAAVVPNHMTKISELIKEGEHEAAAELQRHLVPLSYALSTKYGVPGIKYVLNKMGYKLGPARLPLLPLSEKDMASLDKLISHYQL